MDNVKEKNQRLHRYPYFMGIISVAVLSVVAQIIVVLDCIFPLIVHETDAVSSVMSTCSEVIAGLYGITLTGYIFFADRFQNVSKEDESLYDIVQALLLRYNHMAGIISVMCLVCIVCGEGIVLYGTNTILPQGLYRFIVNETLLVFFWTFDFILYFVITVLDPQKVSRISAQKKKKLSEDTSAGDPREFMAAWEDIEALLVSYYEKLLEGLRFVPAPIGKNRPQLIQTLEQLRNYGRISHGLWRKLDKLRMYHNLVLHDPAMTVSREMCDLAREVLAELKAKQP